MKLRDEVMATLGKSKANPKNLPVGEHEEWKVAIYDDMARLTKWAIYEFNRWLDEEYRTYGGKTMQHYYNEFSTPDFTKRIQVDFNDEFVNWLVDFGITLDGTEHEDVDPDSEEYAELLVEKWAKGALMSLAATMLVDDGGDTFRSVVASEPEGTIVQHLEIDRENLEEYYGDELTPEQIQDIANKTRNRRMYK